VHPQFDAWYRPFALTSPPLPYMFLDVSVAPTAVNSAVVIQTGHIVGFVSFHLSRRMGNGILDIFTCAICAPPTRHCPFISLQI
jgi:hypothetical protein